MLLLDIDGVIRDVGGSYRRALAETVHHYSGWRPDAATVDGLKAEGRWNNDWQASLELLRRCGMAPLPDFESLVVVFSDYYFGGDPHGDPAQWQGFINDEPLLVDAAFFGDLEEGGIVWGFVSGAEPSSARYVLEQRLGLNDPPLIAMGDAPDKPDPAGLLQLADLLLQRQCSPSMGPGAPPIAYLGDTVADVQTVRNARAVVPDQTFVSLGVAPPHLHGSPARAGYEQLLRQAGADAVLVHTGAAVQHLLALQG